MKKTIATGMLASLLLIAAVPSSHAVTKPIEQSVAQQATKIDLNSATLEQLTSLKGIGEVKAKAIIEHRSKVGGFTHLDDLKEVKGIGEKLVQKLEKHLSV